MYFGTDSEFDVAFADVGLKDSVDNFKEADGAEGGFALTDYFQRRFSAMVRVISPSSLSALYSQYIPPRSPCSLI